LCDIGRVAVTDCFKLAVFYTFIVYSTTAAAVTYHKGQTLFLATEYTGGAGNI